jgi:metal-responsive CopG/Arc/MetJ family transcriptional regulator
MRSGCTKIAISLEPQLLAHAERLRRVTGESRSAIVARSLRTLLAEEQHAYDVARYVAAYRELPESGAEVRAARAAAKRTLSMLPWNEE